MNEASIKMVNLLKPLVLTLCFVTVAAGVLGIASPSRLAELIVLIQQPVGLYAAAGMRLVFGGSLLGVASGSRAPIVLTSMSVAIRLRSTCGSRMDRAVSSAVAMAQKSSLVQKKKLTSPSKRILLGCDDVM